MLHISAKHSGKQKSGRVKHSVARLLPVGVVLLAFSSFALAQQNTSSSAQGNKLGVFAGFTDRRDADFTVGMQIEHMLNQTWSTGAVLEYTPNERNNNDATMLLGLVNYRPDFNRQLKLTGGAGVEFNDNSDDGVMFRTAVSYDLFYEGPLTFTPMVGFNFGENQESITLGASLQFNF